MDNTLLATKLHIPPPCQILVLRPRLSAALSKALATIAANDPSFDHSLPLNSWGGAAQALTALRAPRWFLHYGKTDDLRHLMTRWVSALLRAEGFQQQMNPWTGEFSTSPGYSPAMYVFIDFVDRLRTLRGPAQP